MDAKIAVVIPSYKVCNHILNVLSNIGPEVNRIFVVDDCCPEGSGEFVRNNCHDVRVSVICNKKNQGVGGAVMIGYRAAISENADVIVKVDGDGQMDPRLIPRFVRPILKGQADYTKGNRFYDLRNISQMPAVRLVGNGILSFLTKFSTGYWHIFDPTNGYTAIHAKVAAFLPMDRISKSYFFESDILFRLNTIRAVVVDVPMNAVYNDEESNMKIHKILGEFATKHIVNLSKRIAYNYFLRDMTLASIELVVGFVLLIFGLIFGCFHWARAIATESSTPLGTIMLSAIPVLVGLQLLIAFLGFDISNVPKRPIHDDLPNDFCFFNDIDGANIL